MQRIYGTSGPSPEIIFVPSGAEPTPEPRPPHSPTSPKTSDMPAPRDLRKKRVSFQEEVEEVPAMVVYDDNETQTEAEVRRPSISCDELAMMTAVPDDLVPNLIEKLRVASDLSHEKCKLVIDVVVGVLGDSVPGWARKCNQIKERLLAMDTNLTTPDAFAQSSDAVHLKTHFR